MLCPSYLQVLELNLDNCRTTGQVEGLTENFVNLDYLSLNNAGLTSLKNFPKLPNLRRVSTKISCDDSSFKLFLVVFNDRFSLGRKLAKLGVILNS